MTPCPASNRRRNFISGTQRSLATRRSVLFDIWKWIICGTSRRQRYIKQRGTKVRINIYDFLDDWIRKVCNWVERVAQSEGNKWNEEESNCTVVNRAIHRCKIRTSLRIFYSPRSTFYWNTTNAQTHCGTLWNFCSSRSLRNAARCTIGCPHLNA